MIWIYDTWDVIANSIISFNSIIIKNSLNYYFDVYVYCCHSPNFPSPLSHSTSGMKFFTSNLKKEIIFHTFHDIAQCLHSVFLTGNCNVIVSHGRRYVATCKLKCHCTKLHRIVKQIYIYWQREITWTMGSWSFVPGLSESEDPLFRVWKMQYCCLYRMYIIGRYSYSYSYSSTRTGTRTHVIIKYSYLYSYSHILQVLVLVLVNLVLAPTLEASGPKWMFPWSPDMIRNFDDEYDFINIIYKCCCVG